MSQYIPLVKIRYKGFEGSGRGKVVPGRGDIIDSGPTTSTLSSSRRLRDSRCTDEHKFFALACLTMVDSRTSGCVSASNSTKAAPAFNTASIATTVHRDFSKHSGTITPGVTPDSTK